jgi:hypothetical protein
MWLPMNPAPPVMMTFKLTLLAQEHGDSLQVKPAVFENTKNVALCRGQDFPILNRTRNVGVKI